MLSPGGGGDGERDDGRVLALVDGDDVDGGGEGEREGMMD